MGRDASSQNIRADLNSQTSCLAVIHYCSSVILDHSVCASDNFIVARARLYISCVTHGNFRKQPLGLEIQHVNSNIWFLGQETDEDHQPRIPQPPPLSRPSFMLSSELAVVKDLTPPRIKQKAKTSCVRTPQHSRIIRHPNHLTTHRTCSPCYKK
jgi:hypothetical protein